jgi:hypothetical protein
VPTAVLEALVVWATCVSSFYTSAVHIPYPVVSLAAFAELDTISLLQLWNNPIQIFPDAFPNRNLESIIAEVLVIHRFIRVWMKVISHKSRGLELFVTACEVYLPVVCGPLPYI